MSISNLNKIFILLILIFLFSTRLLNCQNSINPDSLNRFDSKHKKHGYWIEFVNNKLKVVKKPDKATFFRYIYFYHGISSYPPNYVLGKVTLLIQGNKKNDSLVIMNGVYTLQKKQKRICEETYQNGILLYCKTFYSNGNTADFLDFTRKIKNQEFSFFHTTYTKLGEIEREGFVGLVNKKTKASPSSSLK
jgi:hypothetical protein